MRRHRYALGDSRRESARLRVQARLWDPDSFALFDRLGIRPGWKVLEIGPGQGSLHLELRRRARGPIDAVEPSPVFATRLRRLCGKDGHGQGQIWTVGLREAPLPRRHYDLIFARWVFLFLPDPAAHLRKLARALKPGGLLALQDYHRGAFAMIPQPAEWENFAMAERRFFEAQGANVSPAETLPTLYRRAGLRVEQIEPIIKMGHPGSPTWNWMTTFFLGMMDRYAKHPPFSPTQAIRLRRWWRAAARNPSSILIAPAVVNVVGRKPRTRR
ncbi:MAG TPA: class I SAM-dependent methyltransferase [Gemmatimonadales bacterium]|jgi:SAM-dependent methyltransferase|nr:class I SAM-dependent methyltransferase [Gemmatimonadales bacterium]